MTSERRAYLIISGGAIVAGCSFAQAVEHWTPQMIFGITGVVVGAFVNGLVKSPRDGAIADAADPAPTEVTAKTDVTKTVHTEAEPKAQS